MLGRDKSKGVELADSDEEGEEGGGEKVEEDSDEVVGDSDEEGV